MAITKQHQEFYPINMTDDGWEIPPGYPATSTVRQKILSGPLDEKNKKGGRSRLLKFGPGDFSKVPFVHDYWEEVFLIQGDLTVGNDEHGNGGEPFSAFTYACRPPGVKHGPFKSETGCLLFEIHYYDPA